MKSIYKFSVLIFVLICGAWVEGYTQTGTLKGKIIDSKTQEAIIGANVVIDGTTTGASTDLDGNFNIKAIPAGTYNVVISFLSYKTKKMEGILIESGKISVLNTDIEEDVENLGEVVIVSERETGSEISVIEELKQAEQVAVGVSSEQIAKTQDKDASQVIKRIPGVTIVDERFVMVRGLSERYNAVLLNGVLTPSSEVDVKAFSFNIIPSNTIDRMFIYKSGAPELPGEFAGGIIKIFTKNIPDENFTSLSISSSYRLGTTGHNMQMYQGSSTDFLGFDNGTRQLPNNFPSLLTNVSNAQRAEASRTLSNNWTLSPQQALPDLSLNFSMGRRFKWGNTRVANLTAVTYSNSRQIANIERFRYQVFDPSIQRSPQIFRFNDYMSEQTVRIGIMHNWTFSVNAKTKIEFRNLFNQTGIKEGVFRTGSEAVNNFDVQNYALRYESRSIYTGQVAGQHELKDGKSNLDWTLGFSFTNRREPDYRRYRTQTPSGSGNDFRVSLPPGASLFDNARFFSNLNETVFTGALNYESRIRFRGSDDNPIKLRAGFYVERKDRDFTARWMALGIANISTFDNSLTSPSIQQMFDPQNINAVTGFSLQEGTLPRDRYTASNTLVAAYLGAFMPLSDKLNIAFGLRIEHNIQLLNSADQGGTPININNTITSPLPSINISYNLNERMLLRGAYCLSINRPEFRELAPFLYYDFNFETNIIGNPRLKTPSIQNADLRWEFYPREGELISFGVFYKRFENPIEMRTIITGGNAQQFDFINAIAAQNFGAEVEIRKGFLESGSKFIRDLTFTFNASWIQSSVDLGAAAVVQDRNRPMMNQSPFIVNTGLFYNNRESKFQATILYNVYGRRLFAVGDVFYPSIWEMPRNIVDLSITKGFGKSLEIRLGIQDLLNAPVQLVQDSNRDAKITGIDERIMFFQRGTSVSLGLKYNF